MSATEPSSRYFARRKSINRLGTLYGINPSAKNVFPTRSHRRQHQQRNQEHLSSPAWIDGSNRKSISKNNNRPRSAPAKGSVPRRQQRPSSSHVQKHGWRPTSHGAGTHESLWKQRPNYLTTEELEWFGEHGHFETRTEVDNNAYQHRCNRPSTAIPRVDSRAHFLVPKSATRGARCQYCAEKGRFAPLERGSKPSRMVAGQRVKEIRADMSYLMHSTLLCNRELSPRSLHARLNAPELERQRRANLRGPASERLRSHVVFKSFSNEQLRKVLQRSANDAQHSVPGDDGVLPSHLNRMQFMRAMSYLGFVHSDNKLMSRLYSSFDVNSNDSISIKQFVNHFNQPRSKSVVFGPN